MRPDPLMFWVALRAQGNSRKFGAIAQATITAINTHPQQALEVLSLALANWRAAKQGFLAGDFTQGGKPSPALLALAGNQSPAQEATGEFPLTEAASPSRVPEPTRESAKPILFVEEIFADENAFAEAALTQETASESPSAPSVSEPTIKAVKRRSRSVMMGAGSTWSRSSSARSPLVPLLLNTWPNSPQNVSTT